MDDVLKPLELELMKDDPIHFPTFRHGRSNWVEYSMTKSMPLGMPYEKYDPNAEWKPNGRLSFVFQVADQDATRLFLCSHWQKKRTCGKTCLAKRRSQCK